MTRKKHWIKWEMNGWAGRDGFTGKCFIFTSRYKTEKSMLEGLKSMRRKGHVILSTSNTYSYIKNNYEDLK